MIDKKLTNRIRRINETALLFKARDDYPELFKEKVYKIDLNEDYELRFSIIKQTSIFNMYLPLDVCTNIVMLIRDMLNTPESILDYDRLMSSFSLLGKSYTEAVEQFGIFGDDPLFYEGLKVQKTIIPSLKHYSIITNEMLSTISQVE